MADASDTAPTNAALDALFERSLRARVSEHPTNVPRGKQARTLLVVEGAALADFRKRLELVPGPGPHCLCLGDMIVSFEDARGVAIDELTFHHGQTIRWDGPWSWRDAAIADPNALIDWLDAQGVHDYAQDRARAEVEGRRRRVERERWLAAAPAQLRERLPALESDAMGMPRRLAQAEVADLLALLGEPREAARMLLHWYGSGAGPWSGFPSYETIPMPLLLELGADTLLASLGGHELDDATLDGLARYFGDHELGRTRRSDTAKLGEPLRSRLLARTEAQAIGDNHRRLAAALRRPEPLALAAGELARHPDRDLSAVVSAAGRVFAVEGFGLVRFDPGSASPITLLERKPMFASLAADAGNLYAALGNEGTILAIPHAGGEPLELATGRGRPLSVRVRGHTLAWLDQPWINDPAKSPYSIATTVVCAIDLRSGVLHELASYVGSAWDLALSDEHVVWVCKTDAGLGIARVALAGGPCDTIVDAIADHEPSGGFVHLASRGDELIVAVPTKSWLREGVELRRIALDGTPLGVLDFVPGYFNGLDANDELVALVVARRRSLLVQAWARSGRSSSMKLAKQPGPLVAPSVDAQGVVLALGPSIYRLAAP